MLKNNVVSDMTVHNFRQQSCSLINVRSLPTPANDNLQKVEIYLIISFNNENFIFIT